LKKTAVNIFLYALIGILISIPYTVTLGIWLSGSEDKLMTIMRIFLLNTAIIGPCAVIVGFFYALAYKSLNLKTVVKKLSIGYLIGLGLALFLTFGGMLSGTGPAAIGSFLFIPFIIPAPAFVMIFRHILFNNL